MAGSAEVTLHGSARLTQDVDIVYARDAENLGRIARALAPLRPYLRGARCRCLDLPTLIAAKIASGRPKDLEAIAELRALLDERSPES